VLPESVAWTPQTVGWVILLVALTTAAVWRMVQSYRIRVANQYRVAALEQLAEIESALGHPDRREAALSVLPVLVKRVALSFADRDLVASLTSEPWLEFLDETYGGSGFTKGPGRVLHELAYAPPSEGEPDEDRGATELIVLVRDWIQGHDLRRVRREGERA
jgi:hypothetical protein